MHTIASKQTTVCTETAEQRAVLEKSATSTQIEAALHRARQLRAADPAPKAWLSDYIDLAA